MKTKPRLQVGGAINPRTSVYVVRPSDDELLRLLEGGEYANVLCSRQMGKSSLLMRTKARLAEKGYRTAAIDVAGYLGSSSEADEWYQGLLDEIAHQLRSGIDVKAWWAASRAVTPNQRLIQFFRDEIAAKAAEPVVVFLDEIDSTHKLPYTDDFFVAIRAMYNDRASEGLYDRITFCLAGVATPNELIKDRRTTPYNIGRTLELQDFDPGRDDLSSLVRAMAEEPAKGEAIVQAVLRWTGGHPYLTVRLCDQLVAAGKTLRDEVDGAIEAEFASLDHLHSDVHFQQVLRFLNERVEDKLAALTLYRRIHAGRRLRDQTTPAHIALRLAGLVKRDPRGYLMVRNPIYARVFTDEWAAKALEASSNSFNKLLVMLDPDRELAGEEYIRLRDNLTNYFRWRGFQSSEDLADATLDRVATRLEEGEAITNIAAYSFGVARLIVMEARRKEKTAQEIARERDLMVSEDEYQESHQHLLSTCFERCLKNLPPDSRELIVQYYQESGHAKIADRTALAQRLGLPLNALRIRAVRIRATLRACIQQCLNEEEGRKIN